MTDRDKPGVDWQAKHATAGQNAKNVADRPYNGWQDTAHAVSDSDITTNPGNPIEDNQ